MAFGGAPDTRKSDALADEAAQLAQEERKNVKIKAAKEARAAAARRSAIAANQSRGSQTSSGSQLGVRTSSDLGGYK